MGTHPATPMAGTARARELVRLQREEDHIRVETERARKEILAQLKTPEGKKFLKAEARRQKVRVRPAVLCGTTDMRTAWREGGCGVVRPEEPRLWASRQAQRGWVLYGMDVRQHAGVECLLRVCRATPHGTVVAPSLGGTKEARERVRRAAGRGGADGGQAGGHIQHI